MCAVYPTGRTGLTLTRDRFGSDYHSRGVAGHGVVGRSWAALEPISTHIIMANIMIMGDSWALGEWGGRDTAQGYRVLHPGTEQYLRSAGHIVRSVANGGSSNWAQVDRMSPHHAYQQSPHSPHSAHDTEVIIWFLTDPLRDCASLQCQIPEAWQEYWSLQDRLMRASLADMARLYPGRRILLVGGVAAVPAWVSREFPQFHVVVTSLLHWLIPQAPRWLLTALCRAWRYGDCDRRLLDHWERCEMQGANFGWRAEHRTDSAEHRWFWPDGAHPNRLAHRRLTEELILPLLAAEQVTDQPSV